MKERYMTIKFSFLVFKVGVLILNDSNFLVIFLQGRIGLEFVSGFSKIDILK